MDGDAFRELTEPYRGELRVHCYRMLGNLHDAEDVLQETLLAAWQGIAGFEGRASMRTWLYRIATNRCLNKRRSRRAKEWDIPGVELPEPTRLGEVLWLEPFPDALLPEESYERRESISLAFVTALQTLPPRQVAVLILRDVLGFHTDEVAGMLDTTADSVKSALKRARAGLPQPPSRAADEGEIVTRFVEAWEAADVDALVELLTDDVFIAMPPMPYEYVGREAVAGFCAALFRGGRRFSLLPTRANGQPAFVAYLRTGQAVGLYVLTLNGGKISAMTRFERNDEFGADRRSIPA
ncbi:RNA polymerase subunit sigma-70 [Actinoplanes sp. CA-142083]|uniref:RNA polymerase subunit sigma-70 n=1 Tax=Actinoplanes sp. CA-142083 TaxID=3239903 RepID=UPI003D90D1A1